jgi:hypothetical protein
VTVPSHRTRRHRHERFGLRAGVYHDVATVTATEPFSTTLPCAVTVSPDTLVRR